MSTLQAVAAGKVATSLRCCSKRSPPRAARHNARSMAVLADNSRTKPFAKELGGVAKKYNPAMALPPSVKATPEFHWKSPARARRQRRRQNDRPSDRGARRKDPRAAYCWGEKF